MPSGPFLRNLRSATLARHTLSLIAFRHRLTLGGPFCFGSPENPKEGFGEHEAEIE